MRPRTSYIVQFIFYLGRYIVGYTVENFVLRRRVSGVFTAFSHCKYGGFFKTLCLVREANLQSEVESRFYSQFRTFEENLNFMGYG